MFSVRQYPRDCSDIQDNGMRYSGIYTIYPESHLSPRGIEVFCDFNTDGGHWTVGLLLLYLRCVPGVFTIQYGSKCGTYVFVSLFQNVQALCFHRRRNPGACPQ